MIPSISRVIARLRDHTNAQNQTGFSDSQAIRWIDQAVEDVALELRTSGATHYVRSNNSFLPYSSWTQDTDDVRRWTTPISPHQVQAILALWERKAGTERVLIRHADDRRSPNTVRRELDRDSYTVSDKTYEIVGNRIVLYGVLTSSFAADLEFDHPHHGSFIGILKAGSYAVVGSNTQFAVEYASTPVADGSGRKGELVKIDDWYNGSFLICTNNGIQTPREVIDYTPAATEATFLLRGSATEFSSGTPGVETVLNLPADFSELVAMKAAANFVASRGNSKHLALIEERMARVMLNFIAAAEQRSNDGPAFVHASYNRP